MALKELAPPHAHVYNWLDSLAWRMIWHSSGLCETQKNRLSHLVEQAAQGHAQTITVRGQPRAVVISIDDDVRLTQPHIGLVEFLRETPWFGVDLHLERSSEPGRAAHLD